MGSVIRQLHVWKSDLWRLVIYVLIPLVRMIVYVVDVTSDVYVAFIHYNQQRYWWCACTLMIVLMTGMVLSALDVYLRRDDDVTTTYKVVWMVCQLLLVSPLFRAVLTVVHGIKTFRKPECTVTNSNGTVTPDFDAIRMREQFKGSDSYSVVMFLIESSLEAAPQLILQFYILFVQAKKELTFPLISCFLSLSSLATSITSYERTEQERRDKDPSIISFALYFIWRFLMISSRVIALSFFASAYRIVFLVSSTIHVAMMFLWLQPKHKKCFMSGVFQRILFASVYLLYLCHFMDGLSSKRNQILYYGIVFIENILMVLIPYQFVIPRQWYSFYIVGGVPAMNILGIILQAAYYYVYYKQSRQEREEYHVMHVRIQPPLPRFDATQEPLIRSVL